jgi:hypothetical protein
MESYPESRAAGSPVALLLLPLHLIPARFLLLLAQATIAACVQETAAHRARGAAATSHAALWRDADAAKTVLVKHGGGCLSAQWSSRPLPTVTSRGWGPRLPDE